MKAERRPSCADTGGEEEVPNAIIVKGDGWYSADFHRRRRRRKGAGRISLD